MKQRLSLIFFIITAAVSYAQNETFTSQSPYMIPRRILVGDQAALIIPLSNIDNNTTENSDIFLTPLSSDFPSHPDVDFYRIVLEQRSGRRRLVIEFSAFVTGVIELPVIEIEGIQFSGLTVIVDSVLDNLSTPALSAPASSLAMPGTAFLLYGTITGFILLILFSVWAVLKGKIVICKLMEKWKRWRLFSSIKKAEKRLSKSVSNGDNSRVILDDLSEQFRNFLSVLTGVNCRTMTAGEFDKFSLHAVMPAITQHKDISAFFLHDFFCELDDLRFSGINAASQDILYLLARLRRFISAVEKAGTSKEISRKKEKPTNGELAA